MRHTHIRIASAITSLALLGTMAGFASLASAEAGGPSVVLSSVSASTTNAASIPVTATFSEEVTGFTSSDVAVTNATVANFTGSSTSFTFDVMPSAAGVVTVTVPADVASSTASSTPGNQASNTLTFTSTLGETLAISNVAVSDIGTSSATVSWNTDVGATGQVFYGTTTSYGSASALNASATTTHSIALANLTEATTYHFQVESTNGSTTATSSDQVFVTASTASTTPLAVTGVDTVQGDATADDTFAHGWQWTMHLTVPDIENAFRMKFSDFTSGSSNIPAGSNIRIFSAQSSNATSEGTAITETDNNYGGWLYLNGDTAALTAGRQIDVTIQVRVPSGTAAGSYTTTFGAQSIPQSATSTTP